MRPNEDPRYLAKCPTCGADPGRPCRSIEVSFASVQPGRAAKRNPIEFGYRVQPHAARVAASSAQKGEAKR